MEVGLTLSLIGAALVATLSGLGTAWGVSIPGRAANGLLSEEPEKFGSSLIYAGRLAPVVLVSFVFSFVYIFVTNTRVRILPALIAGVSAGILWALTGKLFASFVVGSTKYAAIYSRRSAVFVGSQAT